jgi:hypothetical protein
MARKQNAKQQHAKQQHANPQDGGFLFAIPAGLAALAKTLATAVAAGAATKAGELGMSALAGKGAAGGASRPAGKGGCRSKKCGGGAHPAGGAARPAGGSLYTPIHSLPKQKPKKNSFLYLLQPGAQVTM